METKKCAKCECEKSIELFSWQNKKQNKRKSRCKECHNFDQRQYNARVRALRKPKPKLEVPEGCMYCRVCEQTKTKEEFYPSHRERVESRCIACLKEISAKRHKETYQDKKQYYVDYYQKNKERRKKWQTEYRHTERGKESNNKFKSKPEQRIRKRQAERVKQALRRKNIDKCHTTLKYIGCTAKELKQHLESQFKEGMNWENYGFEGWHIDHIRPISSFDLTDPDQQLECFNYKNLQPLWAEENLSKGAMWNG